MLMMRQQPVILSISCWCDMMIRVWNKKSASFASCHAAAAAPLNKKFTLLAIRSGYFICAISLFCLIYFLAMDLKVSTKKQNNGCGGEALAFSVDNILGKPFKRKALAEHQRPLKSPKEELSELLSFNSYFLLKNLILNLIQSFSKL